jgi:hypothetical protein
MTTIYSFLPSISITAEGAGLTQNTPMNSRKITLHKGILNKFEVKAFDANRKPINLGQKQVFWHIIQLGFGAIALGPCTIIDRTKGKMVVELNDADIGDLEDGMYLMTFSIVDPEGNETYFYSSLTGGVSIVIEVLEGMFMESSKTNQTMRFVAGPDGWYYTEAFQPRPGNIGVHTASFRMFNFTGQIKAEMSMDESLTGTTWKTINLEPGLPTVSFNDESLTTGYTFEAEFQWVRFGWKPLTKDSGQVDKIIYRS